MMLSTDDASKVSRRVTKKQYAGQPTCPNFVDSFAILKKKKAYFYKRETWEGVKHAVYKCILRALAFLSTEMKPFEARSILARGFGKRVSQCVLSGPVFAHVDETFEH